MLRHPKQISVVVHTSSPDVCLKRSFEGLARQTFPHEDFEVVVALAHEPSNAVQTVLKERAWPFEVRLFSQAGADLLTVRNMATAYAQGDILVFLDGAVRPDSGMLEKHHTAHKQGNRLVVLGNIRVDPESPSRFAAETIAFESLVRARCSFFDYHPLVSDFCENNFSVRRSEFSASGGWDKTWPNGGRVHELEMGLRLKQAALRFQFEPDASGSRYYDQELSWFLSDLKQLGREQIQFFRRHPDALRELRFPLIITGTWWQRAAFGLACMMPEAALTSFAKLAAGFSHPRGPSGAGDAAWLLMKSIAGLFLARGFWNEAADLRSVTHQLRLCVPILFYPITSTISNSREVFSLQNFARHMDWLEEWGYRTISLSDFCDWRDKLKPLPSKPIVLTFSGDTRGIYESVLPILGKYGFRASAFLEVEEITEQTGKATCSDSTTKFGIRALAEKGIEIGVNLSFAVPDMRGAERAFQDQLSATAASLSEVNRGGARIFASRTGRWAFLLPDLAKAFGFSAGCSDLSGLNSYHANPIFLKTIRAAGEMRKARFRDSLRQRDDSEGTLEKWRSVYSGTTRAGWTVETANFYRLQAAELRALMKGERFERVLELGCGNGALYPFLDVGRTLYKGVDISPSMLAAFKRKCPQVELECGDASTYSDPENQYDLIFSNGLAQHLNRQMINDHFARARTMMHKDSLFICAGVPWKSQRWSFYAGKLTKPWNCRVATWAKSWVKIAAYGDGMGSWFELREFYNLAVRHNFSVEFYGSISHLHAFHAVMKLAQEGDGS